MLLGYPPYFWCCVLLDALHNSCEPRRSPPAKDEELGLDSFIERDGNDTSITVTEDSTGKEMKILLEQQSMVIHRAIVCRGTTCFRSKDLKQVIKLSWPSDLWPSETDLLRRGHDHGVDGVAKLLGHRPIASIEELRDGLALPRLTPLPECIMRRLDLKHFPMPRMEGSLECSAGISLLSSLHLSLRGSNLGHIHLTSGRRSFKQTTKHSPYGSYLEVVQWLLGLNVGVLALESEGFTSLHYASSGNLEIAKVLYEGGVNVKGSPAIVFSRATNGPVG